MADEIEKKEEVTEEVIEITEETESESSSTEETVDYEALAKQERERREAAEALLIKNKRIAKRHEEVEEEPENEEDKPITRADLADILRTERHATQKELKEAQALDIARANTASEAEAQAALLFWKNRVIPTGNLEDDIKFAIGGLNQKKVTAKNAELARALKSKDSVTTDPTSTHRDGLVTTAQKLAPNSPLTGFKHEGNGLYSKKLASGKTMFKNTKAQGNERKTWVE